MSFQSLLRGEIQDVPATMEDRVRAAKEWIDGRGRGWMLVGYQSEGFYYDGRGLPGWRFRRWDDLEVEP